MKLGIIGNGFVGNAIAHAFIPCMDVKIYDKNPEKSFNTLEEVVNDSDVVFVSVPTPQLESGECNSEIVESVLQELNQAKDLLVIVKSTIPGYKLQTIKEQCINLRIVYNPEFLTEKNYINDFRNPPMHVFGGAIKDTEEVEQGNQEKSDTTQNERQGRSSSRSMARSLLRG